MWHPLKELDSSLAKLSRRKQTFTFCLNTQWENIHILKAGSKKKKKGFKEFPEGPSEGQLLWTVKKKYTVTDCVTHSEELLMLFCVITLFLSRFNTHTLLSSVSGCVWCLTPWTWTDRRQRKRRGCVGRPEDELKQTRNSQRQGGGGGAWGVYCWSWIRAWPPGGL